MTRGSARHLASLTFFMFAEAADLGTRYGCTPLSIVGPGCSGSLLGIVKQGRYQALSRFRLGDEALAMWPFDPSQSPPIAPGMDTDAGPEAVRAAPLHRDGEYANRFVERQCPLCRIGILSTYHLTCECLDPRMLRCRSDLLSSLPGLVAAIASECARAIHLDAACDGGSVNVYSSHTDNVNVDTGADSAQSTRFSFLPPEQRDAVRNASLAPLGHSGHLQTDEERFVLYWLTTASPWPSRVATMQQPLAQGLGALFDRYLTAAQNRWITRLASRWLSWSESAVTSSSIGSAWQEALRTYA